MGRKRINIDKAEFEKLCRMQCTEAEISAFFDVSDDTILRWCQRTYKKTFEEVFAEKRAGGKASLRRAQFDLALTGNATMLIWLGKQWLGQCEKPARNDEAEDSISDEVEALLSEFDEE